MMYPEILSKTIIMYLIVLYGIYSLIVKRDFSLINFFVLLLPIKGLLLEVGLQLYMFYIPIFLAFFFELIVNSGKKFRYNISWLVFVSYVVFSTIIITNLFVPYFQPNVYNSFFRTEGRYISYLFKFLFLNAGIFFIVYSLVKNKQDIISVLKTYILSMKILTVLGFLQFVIYYLTGFNITPIGVNGKGELRHALSDLILSNIGVPRVCSIGGEPKGLAASLCIALTILITSKLYRIPLTKHINYWIWGMIFVLLLTLSTGGVILFVVMLVILVFIRILMGEIKIKFTWKVFVFFIFFSIVGAISYNTITNIIDARIVQRSERLLNEDVDYAIQSFMIDQPKWTVFGTGSGNIHNFAYPYIEDKWLQKILKHEIFISRYGYIRFISENGFIGLLLFIIFSFGIPFSLYLKRNIVDRSGAFIIISIVVVIFFFIRSLYVEPEMYFLLAVSFAWYRESIKKIL